MALFSPWGNQQFFDDNGNPATGWKIYTYAAGSSTPLATYTTEAGTVAQSNPIILNSLGFVSNPIFLTAGLAYKLVLTNASDVVKGPPVDGITGVTGTASTSQWQASGLTPTYVSATSFTLAGDQTTNFHVKRRIQSTNTAGTITSTITATAYTTLTTVTVVNDSGALDSGLSAVNLGLLTANNPSVPTSYAKSGANSDITSLSAITSINGGPIGGSRNRLINGNFGINQRSYVSGAATTAGQYTLDRWKVTGTGGITFSTTANVTTVTIPSGQTLQQVIEGVNLQSGTHVLSWSGTAQGRIDGGAYGASGAVTATAVGSTNMTVEFNAGTLSLVQLEEGSLASRFEQRPITVELALCQRYLPAFAGTGAALGLFSGQAYATTAAEAVIPFQVQTRIPPTGIIVSNVTDFRVYSAVGGGITPTNFIFERASKNSASVKITTADSLVAGNATILYGGPTGSPSILFTGCEL